MKQWFKIWICYLFHKKEDVCLRHPQDAIYTFDTCIYRGCRKCNIWIPKVGELE